LSFNTPAGHVRYDDKAGRLVSDDRFRLGDRVIPLLGVSAVGGVEGWATANFAGENSPPLFGRIALAGPDAANFFPAPSSVQEVLGPIDGGRILIEGDGASRIVWSRTVEGLARIRPAARTTASPSLSTSQSGISTCTCLPARKQATLCWACICVGVHRMTASTSGSAKLSCKFVVTWSTP
jgi:hypothetical protein